MSILTVLDARQHAIEILEALTSRREEHYVFIGSVEDWLGVEAFLKLGADQLDLKVRNIQTSWLKTLDGVLQHKYTIYLDSKVPPEATADSQAKPPVRQIVADAMCFLLKHRAEGKRAKYVLRSTDGKLHGQILATFKRAANAAGVRLQVRSDESDFGHELRSALWIDQPDLRDDPSGEPIQTHRA